MIGLLSFSVLVIEICVVFIFTLQIYPDLHTGEFYGDTSFYDEN